MCWRRLRVAVLLVTALALGPALALEPNPAERIPNQQAGRLPYQLVPEREITSVTTASPL